MFRDGDKGDPNPAEDWTWTCDDDDHHPGDIIGYKITKKYVEQKRAGSNPMPTTRRPEAPKAPPRITIDPIGIVPKLEFKNHISYSGNEIELTELEAAKLFVHLSELRGKLNSGA